MDIKDTLKEAWTTTLSWLKSHLLLSLILQLILIVGLCIINYKIVDFGNFIGIYFISLGLVIIDFLPILGLFAPMAIWAVVAMTFGDNMKLGISILVLCFITMIIQQIIEPFIVGKVMGISAFEEILSCVAGFLLFGGSAIGLIAGPIVYTVAKVIYLKHKHQPLIVERHGYTMPSASKQNAKDITDDVTNANE